MRVKMVCGAPIGLREGSDWFVGVGLVCVVLGLVCWPGRGGLVQLFVGVCWLSISLRVSCCVSLSVTLCLPFARLSACLFVFSMYVSVRVSARMSVWARVGVACPCVCVWVLLRACVRACVRGWVGACVRGWVGGWLAGWVCACVPPPVPEDFAHAILGCLLHVSRVGPHREKPLSRRRCGS